MWKYFQNGRENNTVADFTDGTIQNENQSLTSNGNYPDVPT
jgi:hypothetical protein